MLFSAWSVDHAFLSDEFASSGIGNPQKLQKEKGCKEIYSLSLLG
jgi:hypothetical protein